MKTPNELQHFLLILFSIVMALALVACAGTQAAGDPPTPRSETLPATGVPQSSVSGDALAGLPERLAMTIHDANGDDLAIWNRVTGEFLTYAPSPFDEGHSSWSPDGQWLAFQTERDGNWEIYLVRTSCADETIGCMDGLTNLTQSPGNDMYPNWSADGQVVHMSTRSGNPDIWLTSPDGGEAQQLTTDSGPDWHPNLSPVRGLLALRSDRNDDPEIWSILLSTDSDPVNLTDTPGTDRYPNFSPDGAHLLFVSDRDGNEEVYVMDAEGSNARNLTNNPARDYQPSWTPDGRYVLFVSDRNSKGDLFLLDFETGEVTLLLDFTQPLDWPFWSPVD